MFKIIRHLKIYTIDQRWHKIWRRKFEVVLYVQRKMHTITVHTD